MATLKCLACGQDNKIGDESCASCSSSLNLRLCSACEAINANSAERCHSCSAEFTAQEEVASAVEDAGHEMAVEQRVLPAAWVIGAEQATRRDWRVSAALWLVPVLAVAGSTYYFYGAPQAAPKPAAAVLLAPAAAAQMLEVKAPPVPAAPVVQAKVALEPKPGQAQVTHTRARALETQVKTIPAAAPALTEAPAVLVVQRGRVTHTKADASEAGVAALAPAAVGATVPGTAAKLESTGCTPGVAALGLCRSN